MLDFVQDTLVAITINWILTLVFTGLLVLSVYDQ